MLNNNEPRIKSIITVSTIIYDTTSSYQCTCWLIKEIKVTVIYKSKNSRLRQTVSKWWKRILYSGNRNVLADNNNTSQTSCYKSEGLPRSSWRESKRCASWLEEPEAEALDHDRRSPGVEWRNLETDGRVAGAKGVGVAGRGRWWGRVPLLRVRNPREGRQSFKIATSRPMLDVH